jgi:hypothetical protein
MPYLSSVTLRFAGRVSAKLRAASMFYRVLLSLSDDTTWLCVMEDEYGTK